jgi:hypothetical protein
MAGQMGLTLAIFSAVTLLSSSFVTSKNHVLTTKIAQNDYISLNELFKYQLKLTTLIAFILFFIIYLLLFKIEYININIASRLLSPSLCALIGFSAIASSIIYSMALYVRAHKEEPFVVYSILTGVLSVLLILAGSFFGIYWTVLMYSASIVFISMPITAIIFMRFYRKNAEYK